MRLVSTQTGPALVRRRALKPRAMTNSARVWPRSVGEANKRPEPASFSLRGNYVRCLATRSAPSDVDFLRRARSYGWRRVAAGSVGGLSRGMTSCKTMVMMIRHTGNPFHILSAWLNCFRLYLLKSSNEASAVVHFSNLRDHRRHTTRTFLGT